MKDEAPKNLVWVHRTLAKKSKNTAPAEIETDWQIYKQIQPWF